MTDLNENWAIFNPHNKPANELPVIYGFNNGGSDDWWSGILLAEDGTAFGGHVCSHEGFMPGDLGVLKGHREDLHERFRAHYPNGYRMEFVGLKEVKTHTGLLAAYANNQQARANEKASEVAS